MATVDTLQVRIARRETEAEGIAGFELASADGTPLPARWSRNANLSGGA